MIQQDKGGIRKSIPDTQEIYWDPKWVFPRVEGNLVGGRGRISQYVPRCFGVRTFHDLKVLEGALWRYREEAFCGGSWESDINYIMTPWWHHQKLQLVHASRLFPKCCSTLLFAIKCWTPLRHSSHLLKSWKSSKIHFLLCQPAIINTIITITMIFNWRQSACCFSLERTSRTSTKASFKPTPRGTGEDADSWSWSGWRLKAP